MPAYRQNTRVASAPTGPTAPPKVEIGPEIDSRTGKKDWSRYNASVVGAAWNLRAPLYPPCASGLGYTASYGVHPIEGIPTHGYNIVSFAAKREWLDENEGWTRVRQQSKKKRRVTRSNRIMAEED